MITVQAGVFPGRLSSYVLDDNSTVASVLEMAEIRLEANSEVKVGGTVASTSRTLQNGDIVVVTQKIKGN